jgi:hypothetical protein
VDQRQRFGDRRAGVRFEIIGDLRAVLTTTQSLTLVNIGAGGVLVEVAGPLTVGSLQQVRLTLGGHFNEVAATVRHVAPVQGGPARYLVGLSFDGLPAETLGRIEALVSGLRATAGGGAGA